MFWKHHQISRNNYVSYGFFLLVFSCSDVLIRFFRNIQISTYKKKIQAPKQRTTEILRRFYRMISPRISTGRDSTVLPRRLRCRKLQGGVAADGTDLIGEVVLPGSMQMMTGWWFETSIYTLW